MANRTKVVIVFLVLIIVLLGGILAFTFFIKPKVTGYTTQRQIEGAQILYLDIVRTVTQCQSYPLPVGNQTLHLVALECLQQPPQPAPLVEQTQ